MLRQRRDALVLPAQLVAQLAVGHALAAVEPADELGHLVELAGHGDELLVDQRLLAVELRAGAHPLLLEDRPVRVEEAAERLVERAALLVGQAGDLLGQRRDRVVGRSGRGLGHRPEPGPEGRDEEDHAGCADRATEDDADDEGHAGDGNDRVRQCRGHCLGAGPRESAFDVLTVRRAARFRVRCDVRSASDVRAPGGGARGGSQAVAAPS